MNSFEPTVPVYYTPETGQPPRRIPSLPARVMRKRPPLFLIAALLVTLCATAVILSY